MPSSKCAQLAVRLANARVAHSDRRTRAHKDAVQEAYDTTIDELVARIEVLQTQTRANKDHEHHMIHDFDTDAHAAMAAADGAGQPHPASCSICMEEMHGKVILKCGHEMCPGCFAQHSRVNNTCPFCRDEFAPKPKVQAKMPIEMLDWIADTWAEQETRNTKYNVKAYRRIEGEIVSRDMSVNYFTKMRLINASKQPIGEFDAPEADKHLEYLITDNARHLMEIVKNWYDKDIA